MSVGAALLVQEAQGGAQAVIGYLPAAATTTATRVETVRTIWTYPRAADLAAQVGALIGAIPTPHNGAQILIEPATVQVTITHCPAR